MLIITATQKCSLSISIKDSKGNPAQVDGIPVWSTSNASVLTVAAAADGMSATVSAVGPVAASVQVSVTADADLGSGVETLTGLLDVQVIAGEASVLAISSGTPEEQ